MTITLDHLDCNGLKLRFKEPRILNVDFDNEAQVYFVRDEELGIFTFAENFNDLGRFVEEEIINLWRLYMKENPEDLDEKVKDIRANMSAMLCVI